jgi:hypothetical protein
MFGWWSEDYLINNSNSHIYIYTTELGTNSMVVAMTESSELQPDLLHNWICVGQIYNLINTINFNNKLVMKYTNDDESQIYPKKKQKLSQDEITFTSNKNYGWYSQDFVTKKNNFIFDRNNKSVPEPKVHKYLTPSNSTVLVTHVTSNSNDKPYYPDTICVGEVTKYLETVSFL